jgi:hypothetical protein
MKMSRVAGHSNLRVFQLNTYLGSHRDRPNGPSSHPCQGYFFRWDTLAGCLLGQKTLDVILRKRVEVAHA